MERILVSRQPIYRTDMTPLGYELLFRDSDEDRASFTDGNRATAGVIVNALMEIGLDEMVGKHAAFINFDRDLILGDYCDCLPRERVVLELLETIDPDVAVIQKLRSLKSAGYRIALDNFVYTSRTRRLLDVANFVKVDIRPKGRSTLEPLLRDLQKYPAEFVATKVETPEQFALCKDVGFKYFQGYFFCRPQFVQGRRPPVSRLATLRLITQLNSADFNVKELEKTIQQDVSLSFKLLRYISSAIYCLQHPVNSIGHAIVLIGQERMRVWASLILFSNFNDTARDVVVTATVRARMGEQLARQLGIPRPERLFLAGLLSVVDILTGLPLNDVLPSLPLEPDIINALINDSGELAPAYRCVLAYEKRDWAEAAAAIKLDESAIRVAYRNAVAWALSSLNAFSQLNR